MTTLGLNINDFRQPLLVALAMLLLCVPVAAQDDTDTGFKFLEVKVLLPDGKPAVDATVEINMDGLEFPMLVDKTGTVSLNLPTKGALQLFIRQPGYVPVTARWRRGKQVPAEYTVRLEKAEPVVGVVVDAQGEPVPIAKIFIANADEKLTVTNGRAEDGAVPAAVSDDDGKFELPYPERGLTVVSLHESGWAQFSASDLIKKSPTRVKLLPWSRVEGVVRRGKLPAAGERVALLVLEDHNAEQLEVKWDYLTESKEGGVFSFDRVIAKRLAATRLMYFKSADGEDLPLHSHDVHFNPVAGEESNITIGGSGRTVVGTLSAAGDESSDVNWSRAYVVLKEENVVEDAFGRAIYFYGKSVGLGSTWGRAPPQGIQFPDSRRKTYASTVAEDGSFEIADVPVGRYTVGADLFVDTPGGRQETKLYLYQRRGHTILDSPKGQPEAPIDLGNIELKSLR